MWAGCEKVARTSRPRGERWPPEGRRPLRGPRRGRARGAGGLAVRRGGGGDAAPLGDLANVKRRAIPPDRRRCGCGCDSRRPIVCASKQDPRTERGIRAARRGGRCATAPPARALRGAVFCPGSRGVEGASGRVLDARIGWQRAQTHWARKILSQQRRSSSQAPLSLGSRNPSRMSTGCDFQSDQSLQVAGADPRSLRRSRLTGRQTCKRGANMSARVGTPTRHGQASCSPRPRRQSPSRCLACAAWLADGQRTGTIWLG